MGEDVEAIPLREQAFQLREVMADDILRWSLEVGVRHFDEAAFDARQGVQGHDDEVELARVERGRRLPRVPVRFPEFHAAADLEVREPVAAALNTIEIALDIEPSRRERSVCDGRAEVAEKLRNAFGHLPVDEVGVVGECNRWQAERERASAGSFHRAVRRIPGPLGVHVSVALATSSNPRTVG